MNGHDKWILDTERALDEAPSYVTYFEPAVVCLEALALVEPTNSNSAYGKKRLHGYVSKFNDGKGNIQCMVPGCEAKADAKDLRILEGCCAIAGLCLKDVWDRKGEFEELEVASDGRPYRGGHFCKKPFCEFSCGVSEDGSAGSLGECIDK